MIDGFSPETGKCWLLDELGGEAILLSLYPGFGFAS